MQFKSPVPSLRIFDEAKAKEFYVDYLGFRTRTQRMIKY